MISLFKKNPRNAGKRKSHCIHGHEFNEENTLWYASNGKKKKACRICKTLQRRSNRPLSTRVIIKYVKAPVIPTEAMLNAARDWSIKAFEQAIGNDAAIGCYNAMIGAIDA